MDDAKSVRPSAGREAWQRKNGRGLVREELDVMLHAAAAEYAAGRLANAATLYGRAEAAFTADPRAAYSLAVIDLRLGRFADARRRLKSFVRRRPDDAKAWHNLGVAEQAVGSWAAAAAAYKQALGHQPHAGGTRLNLAIALAVLGLVDGAVEQLRHLAGDPQLGADALTRLAILRPQAVVDPELTELRRIAEDTSIRAEARIGPLFALGAALEARGDEAAAFEALRQGNAMKHKVLSEGPVQTRPNVVATEHARSIERVRRLFTAEFVAAHGGQGDRTVRPIFIIGMPRSGSSLIEQILASHPTIEGMGESDALAGSVNGLFPYPPEVAKGPDHFRRLAKAYLAAQRRRGWSGRGGLTDKTLDNHLHVGLIHLMFPRAVILHATRDPMDTGLACYRQLFGHGAETLYSLSDIGAELRRYQTMIDHWRAALPGRVIEVSYETLVGSPEAEIRRLVTETCGLTWSNECLRFHAAERPVTTASAASVRQPIFDTSVGRWRRHEARLAEMAAALNG